MIIWLIVLIASTLALMLLRASAWVWLAAEVVLLWLGARLAGIELPVLVLLALLSLTPTLLVAIKSVRQSLMTRPALDLFRKIMPGMSATERDAIEAGTVWWDAELFSGKPDWRRLFELPAPRLTPEEQAFLDNEVEQLCAMVSDWETSVKTQDLPPEAWQFIKDKGFLGMIIPRQYGGKQFSAYMHSQVVMKLGSRSSTAAIAVMVPNSLGPAELLLHYGTEAQKRHYLPRLAQGLEIPCFALTSPYAGSDAAAIPDIGIVCKGEHEGCETLGFRVTWRKRYITLAPMATVLGLAFRVRDPDGLLGGSAEPGITCALIPTDHPGVVTGRRHWPLNAVFQNGPTEGKDVFIPMEWVIGGAQQVGRGWRMLMECLAAGRAISLPSSSVGFSKMAVRGTSAYTATRRQFRIEIGKFEGVQEALARMGGHLYMMDATRRLSALAVDAGEKPSVISAISKYHVTERGRIVVNDGMDIIGGKGICMGPGNFLARAYQQVPIAITVEGANILTRCLIIFGQGAIRCHPYVLKELAAAADEDRQRALQEFDRLLFAHLSFVAANAARSLVGGLSGGWLLPASRHAGRATQSYVRAVVHLSSAFALLTDVSMGVLGGTLKFRERISARLGDVLSQLYLVSAVLKRFEDEGRQEADLPYVDWSVQDALNRAQEAIIEVLHNFPNPFIAFLLRGLIFPLGRPYRKPSDVLGTCVAKAMQTPGESRNRLLADAYLPREGDPLACGEQAFVLTPVVQQLEHRLKQDIKDGKLPTMPQNLPELPAWSALALERSLISAQEREALDTFAHYAEQSVRVDDFAADFDRAEMLASQR
ncbi:acyl-CoA dehydrogenase [Herbaspirillum rubrisubalbicans]|uniref:Acyl-coenzyme A dehydrogenase n=1 Tax=Herbaspirillum rubrisubalbicans TaxID=80842 RepID=A0AAD0UF29_9BURK|nr:acyl-CoA dehydrogenase [Herbaspirillum rubrisubalbicans]AYR25824.1 acyl-CoA dehydrogenase [Herbaspirillum rubrisubalbicans]